MVILKLQYNRVFKIIEKHKKIKIEKPQQKTIITLLINYDEFCISNKCHIPIINKTKN